MTTDAIVVVFCADDNYAMQLGVSITSLLLNHVTGSPLELFVLSDGISAENRERLLDCTKAHENVSVRWVELDARLMAGFRPTRRVTRATYIRLLIPQALPLDHDKVIYLDADIVVNGDIEALWRQDVSRHAVLAAQDYDNLVSTPDHFPNHRILGIPASNLYFNAGILVLNLAFWRDNAVAERCVEYLRDHDRTRVFNDQEALNAVLFDAWSLLDTHWNTQEAYYETAFPGVLLGWARRLVGRQPPVNPGISHYCGIRKPWEAGYLGRGRGAFYHYVDKTPWRGWRISRADDMRAIVSHDILRRPRKSLK